ncbi:MAG: TrkA family potassium uptake protein [Planctomycetes bacterium]|nr:TrkA family potassium uptake protein [Planctomycetota bacterium]
MDRYAIIGLGRFGYRLAELLSDAGAEVIAVDRREKVVEDIRDKVAMAICMDGTDEAALLAQGLDKVDVAVVGIGSDFEANILTTVILKQMGVPRVVSRAATGTRGEILRRIGADALANPEEESALRWCHLLLGPRMMEQIPLAEGQSLVQVPTPAQWIGKSIAQLDVRRKYNVNVVAIRHGPTAAGTGAGKPDEAGAGEPDKADPDKQAGSHKPGSSILELPLPQTKLVAGDVLILIGGDEHISALPR